MSALYGIDMKICDTEVNYFLGVILCLLNSKSFIRKTNLLYTDSFQLQDNILPFAD